MTRQEEKFYKVWIYHIASLILCGCSIVFAIFDARDESRHLMLIAFITHATGSVRGDILQLKREKQND